MRGLHIYLGNIGQIRKAIAANDVRSNSSFAVRHSKIPRIVCVYQTRLRRFPIKSILWRPRLRRTLAIEAVEVVHNPDGLFPNSGEMLLREGTSIAGGMAVRSWARKEKQSPGSNANSIAETNAFLSQSTNDKGSYNMYVSGYSTIPISLRSDTGRRPIFRDSKCPYAGHDPRGGFGKSIITRCFMPRDAVP